MSSVYPLWIEKLVFILLIVTAILVGEVALKNHLEGYALWAARICGLPILVLVTTEAIGRILQKLLTSNNR